MKIMAIVMVIIKATIAAILLICKIFDILSFFVFYLFPKKYR